LTVNRAGTALYVVNENELSVTVLDVASLAYARRSRVRERARNGVLLGRTVDRGLQRDL